MDRTRAAVLIASLALGVLAPCRSASADDDEQPRIVALIAENQSRVALPLALALARRLHDTPAAWEQVLTIAGWNSDARAALEALRNLVRLRPGDRARRLALAQRLLWARSTREALPHARWLVARAEERDATALEVATWVLLAERDRDGARSSARRWIAATPADPRPRRVLADLTHWTERWREAHAQYRAMERAGGAARELARERAETLRRDHPTEFRAPGTWWSDNVGVSFGSVGIAGTFQLPWPVVLQARTELGRWAQQGAGDLHFANTYAQVGLELWNGVTPEAVIGIEHDTANNTVPLASAGVRFAFAGRVFGRVFYQYDRHRIGYAATLLDVRAHGPAFTLYVEPTSWLFASAEGMVNWITDDNLRMRGMLAVGVHNPHMVQIEPRVFVQLDGYRDQRPGAVPYFTPTSPWFVGGDVTGRLVLARRLRAEASAGLVYQAGVVAFRPRGMLEVEVLRHLRLNASAGYIGSAQYNQIRVDATIAYLF